MGSAQREGRLVFRRLRARSAPARPADEPRLHLRVSLQAEFRPEPRGQQPRGGSPTRLYWPEQLPCRIVADVGRTDTTERWGPVLLEGRLGLRSLQALRTSGCTVTLSYALSEDDQVLLAER